MGADSRVRSSGADLFELITAQKRVLAAHRWDGNLIVETELRRGGRPFPVPFVLAYRTGFDGQPTLLDAHAGAASVVVDGDGYLFLADPNDADRAAGHGGRVLRRRFPDRTETVLATARGLLSFTAAAGTILATAWADPDAATIEADNDAYATWQHTGELAAFPGPTGWPHQGLRPDHATLRLLIQPAPARPGESGTRDPAVDHSGDGRGSEPSVAHAGESGTPALALPAPDHPGEGRTREPSVGRAGEGGTVDTAGHRPGEGRIRESALDGPGEGRMAEPVLVWLELEPDVELTGEVALTPDGRCGVAGLARTLPDGNRRFGLWLFGVGEPGGGSAYWKAGVDLSAPVASPDGAWFACTAERVSTPLLAPHRGVLLLSPDGSRALDVTDVHDDWLEPQAWHRDDVLCVGAVDGRRRLWRMSAVTGAITLLDVDGSVASVTVSGDEALAVRSAVDYPPEVVAVALDSVAVNIDMLTASTRQLLMQSTGEALAADAGEVVCAPAVAEVVYAPAVAEVVYAPAVAARPDGRLERQTWHDEDGTAWRAWLCLPGEEPDEPLPVLVWCHGGPLLSWTDWSWRWNPWPFVADGYAVLMIDPPLSLGYGRQAIARGWGRWLTEVARTAAGQVRGLVGRDARLDGTRIATMGASFGGWLSIALATLMPEVRLVAAHAGWADVAGVARTCDLNWHWLREYGPPPGPAYARETPQLDDIHASCRLLLSHGAQDGHVPVHEVFGVQRALTSRGVDVRLMILPDEGHSIRRPGNAAAWFRWVRRACADTWGRALR